MVELNYAEDVFDESSDELTNKTCPPEQAKTIVSIDTMNLLWRSAAQQYLARLKTKHGRPSGHVFGFYTQLVAVLKQYATPGDTALVFGFDLSGCKRKRQAFFPEYKANREYREADESLGLSLQEITADIRRLISFLPHSEMASPDFECDDLLAGLVKTYPGRSHVMVTNDRDLWWLKGAQRDLTIVLSGKKTVTNKDLMDKFGLERFEDITVYKALFGDPSDNIPSLLPRVRKQPIVDFINQKPRQLDEVVELLFSGGAGPGARALASSPVFKERLMNHYNTVRLQPPEVLAQYLTTHEGDRNGCIAFLEEFECYSLIDKVVPLFFKETKHGN